MARIATSRVVIGIRQGQWTVTSWRADSPAEGTTEVVALDDLKGLHANLLQYADSSGTIPCPVLHSSSVDFPQDDGAPEGFDAYAALHKVFYEAETAL